MIILFAVGIMGIALIAPIGIDLYNHIVHGNCWANMQETISKMKSDLDSMSISAGEVSKSTYRSITVGECVGAVIIFNRDKNGNYNNYPQNLARFGSVIDDKCSTAYSGGSYILVLPWKTVKEDIQANENLWQRIKSKFTWGYYSDWYKESVQTVRYFLSPTCTGMAGTWDNVYFLPPETAGTNAPNEKDTTACYELRKTAISNKPGEYEYHLEKAADSQCPQNAVQAP